MNLNVRQEFEIPGIYLNGTTEEVEEALLIGATVQASVRKRRGDADVRRITEEKDAEIQRIQVGYQERLGKLSEEISALGAEKAAVSGELLERTKAAARAEREACRLEAEEAARLLKREHDTLAARYETLEARRRAMEESRSLDIQEAVRRTEEMMGKIVASKEQQLVKMEAAYGRLQDSITRQSEEISKLAGTLGKRAANVKTKGNDYEMAFAGLLSRHYGLCKNFELRATGQGAGHEMDIQTVIDGHVVMWELKTYSSTVPKAEVDKFLRDLKENPQASIGVFISKTTDIQGKNSAGPMMIQFESGRMCVYLNRFDDFVGEDDTKVFSMLLGLFRIWWEHRREETGFDRVQIILEAEKAVEELAKRRTEWKRHKAHLEEVSRWTTDLLDESEDRLDRVLKKARNVGDACVHGAEIPEGVFRDTVDEKERMWITTIMKVCVPDGMIEVRELVELLKAHHKLSGDTIRGNIMAIVQDSAIVRKGVVKYIKGVSKFVPPCSIQF
jgi:hypothetical protein